MTFPSIQNFITEIKTRGVAKTSRFWVEMPIPSVLKGFTADDAKLVGLFCEQTQLPELLLATSPVQVDGQHREVVVGKGYGRTSMVFACDQNMVIKNFFDQWIGGAIISAGGILHYPDDYTVDGLTIYQLDAKNNPTYSVGFMRAYPVSMSSIFMDAGSNAYSRLQIDFVYKRWIPAMGDHTNVAIPNLPQDQQPLQTLQSLGGIQIQYGNQASASLLDFATDTGSNN